MDIRVKTMLDFIQSLPEYSNAVIAGGAVRDYYYDLEAKDYDVFVPISDKRGNVNNLISRISKEFKLAGPIVEKGKEYEDARALKGVKEITFEGKVFDIIGKFAPNDDQFGFTVIKDFDFGNSMAFYNGLYIEDNNEHYQRDTQRYTMTLVSMNHITDLPGHMERYIAFRDKLMAAKHQHVAFRAPCLQLKNEKENPYATAKVKKIPLPEGFRNEGIQAPLPAALPIVDVAPAQWDVNPAGEIPLQIRPWAGNAVGEPGRPARVQQPAPARRWADIVAEERANINRIVGARNAAQRERDERGRFRAAVDVAGGLEPMAVMAADFFDARLVGGDIPN